MYTDHLRIGGDVKSWHSSFLQGVLLINHFLIHFCHNLLVHHSLFLSYADFESLARGHTAITNHKCTRKDIPMG